MKRTSVMLAVMVFASSAYAAEISPSDVVFNEDAAVAESLTGVPGDAANGRKVFMNRKKGNCLACHQNSEMADQQFHGEVGPALDGVAERYNEAELRGLLVNSKKRFPDTIMPAFYRADGFVRPLKKFAGKTILSAQEVEDVVAYLLTLK